MRPLYVLICKELPIFKKNYKDGICPFSLVYLFGVHFTGMLFTANEDPKMNTFYIPVSIYKVVLLFRCCVA